ncbi:LuxR C-terminal-related transcriptional regulator [Sphingomonas sp. QA11]|uniref:response regulator transcription factor n=1 Tax=Sphingomonas sp. QA11 TaxID=2950605 RepID=UPI0023491EE5|nr:LuxR C-terminal-related transcriptional regulator [Sphingomonas sp. QA11]WCM27725.1 LuxR C-terminal-related transcriptional regulator [Sphingomonas sp. QA11]
MSASLRAREPENWVLNATERAIAGRKATSTVHNPATTSELLSLREREIAQLVTCGLSNKEIAQMLRISHWTVSTHLRRVFAKLDINRRVELCRLVTNENAPRLPG